MAIKCVSSNGAGLSDSVMRQDFQLPNLPRRHQEIASGKSDDLDAAHIARSVLPVDAARLRRPRADGSRVAMRVLVVAREQMTCERTRTFNALTALAQEFQETLIAAFRLVTEERHNFRVGFESDASAPLRRSLTAMFGRRVDIALSIWHAQGAALDADPIAAAAFASGGLTASVEAWASSDAAVFAPNAGPTACATRCHPGGPEPEVHRIGQIQRSPAAPAAMADTFYHARARRTARTEPGIGERTGRPKSSTLRWNTQTV